MNCPYWEPYLDHGKCKLKLYGGYPSIGVCKLCISRGENNPAYAKALFDRIKTSHPNGVSKISGCCDRADQE